MSYIKGKSGLALPKQTGKMSQKRDLSLKGIEAWSRQLPSSDVRTTAKELFLLLKDSHQASLTYQERYAILNYLRRVLKYVCQTLQKFFENQEILNDQQIPIADLINALQIEMIQGYKLVIEDALQHFFYNRKTLLGALQNSMTYCSKLIFNAYEQHRNAPTGVWLELHSLFIFAKQKHLANKSLKKLVFWQFNFNTLTDLYKHCLLLSITNPTNLQHTQMVQIIYAQESWAPLLSLVDSDNSKSCLFAVDLTQDFPPRYIGTYTSPPPSCCYLNLDKINERILKLLSLSANNNQEKISKLFSPAEIALPVSYLELMLNTWRSLRKRSLERVPTQGTISIGLGISACHWFLSQSIPISNTISSAEPENINLDILPRPTDTPNPTANFQLFSCELINQNESGCCLKWLEAIPAKLQTGEVVGVELDAIKKKWSIGVIRWLKADDDSSMMMGIEILSTHAIAIKARQLDASYSVLTLLFAAQPNKQKPVRLIAPPLPFKSGIDIELEYNNKTYTAKLQKCYSTTPSYHEFGILFPFEQIEFPEHQGDLFSKKISSADNQNLHK